MAGSGSFAFSPSLAALAPARHWLLTLGGLTIVGLIPYLVAFPRLCLLAWLPLIVSYLLCRAGHRLHRAVRRHSEADWLAALRALRWAATVAGAGLVVLITLVVGLALLIHTGVLSGSPSLTS